MIYGKLSEFEKLIPGALPEVVALSLAWLRGLPVAPEIGRYKLDETTGLYAMIMRYETVPAEESRYESHRRAVDLQYTIEGGEGIEWAHTDNLTTDGPFDVDRDLQFYQHGEPSALVKNLPGHFSIYTTTDAHRPKIRIPGFSNVFKAVVKIPLRAFEE